VAVGHEAVLARTRRRAGEAGLARALHDAKRLVMPNALAPVTLALMLTASCQAAPARSPATSARASPVVIVQAPDVASVVEKVSPAVVSLIVVRTFPGGRGLPSIKSGWGTGETGSAPPGEDEAELAQQGQGSGFIIDAAGHVITNAHVVDGAIAVRARLADGRELEATVRGRDAWLDVALLELRGAAQLPAVELGGSAAVRVGEPVLAIGNPYGLGSTVTMGIVSAKGRDLGMGPFDDFLQTDASINPGNSGGPLFDVRGRVIGINTAVLPRAKGLGFAIPIDDVKAALPQLLAKGRVDRGRLGVWVGPLDPAMSRALGAGAPWGAWVTEVEKGSPAEKAGIGPGDVITGVDGAPIAQDQQLQRAVARHQPGERVTVELLRRGQRRSVAVILGTAAQAAEGAPTRAPSGGTDRGAYSLLPGSAPKRSSFR
jgi:serine protease Do